MAEFIDDHVATAGAGDNDRADLCLSGAAGHHYFLIAVSRCNRLNQCPAIVQDLYIGYVGGVFCPHPERQRGGGGGTVAVPPLPGRFDDLMFT